MRSTLFVFVFVVLLTGGAMAHDADWLTRRPIAHRGLHRGADVPENTLAAFRAALAADHPIELDVHLLADEGLAVFHDAELGRLTGREGALAALRTEDLAALRVLGSDEPVPTLPEVLALVGGRVPLLVELKSQPGGAAAVAQAVHEALASYAGDFAVQSFDPEVVAWFREHAPALRRGLLLRGEPEGERTWRAVGERLAAVWRARPHFLGGDVRHLPYAPLSLLRGLGLPLLAWTVRDEALLARGRAEADNIIFESVSPD